MSSARFFSLATNALLARYLGISDFGKFSIFYLFMTLSWIVPQAFDISFIRYAKESSEENHRDDYFRSTVQLKIIYGLLSFLIAAPFSFFASKFFFQKPELFSFITLGIICGIFLSYINTIATLFQEKESFTGYAFLQGVYSLSVFFCILVTIFLNNIKINVVLWIYFVVSSILFLISLIFIIRRTARIKVFDIIILKRLIRFGRWILATSVVFYIFPRIDTTFLTRYLDFRTVGLYSVASQLAVIVNVVSGSMSAVFLPKSMNAAKNPDDFFRYLKDSVVPVLIIVFVIIFLIVLAPFLIKIIYSSQYLESIDCFRILMAGYISSTFYLPFSFLFYSLNLPQVRFVLELSKLILAAILLYFLIPYFGLIGAAISVFIALFVNCVISICIIVIQLKKKWAYKFKNIL